ncbi:MAG: adenosine deaminase, partial [Terracidiphilus sp.]
MRNGIAFLLLRVAGSLALAALAGCGQKPTGQGVPTKAEARTGLIYEANLHQGPETLRAFLNDFPKGADLHVHLSGAVYA